VTIEKTQKPPIGLNRGICRLHLGVGHVQRPPRLVDARLWWLRCPITEGLLRNAGNQLLRLANNTTATIAVRIPDNLLLFLIEAIYESAIQLSGACEVDSPAGNDLACLDTCQARFVWEWRRAALAGERMTKCADAVNAYELRNNI
jgi:hypothetical protein